MYLYVLVKILCVAFLLTLTSNLYFGCGSLAVIHKLSKQCRRLLRGNFHQLSDRSSGLGFSVEVSQNFSLYDFVLLLLLGEGVLALLVGTVHSRNLLSGKFFEFVGNLSVSNSVEKISLCHNVSSFSTVRRWRQLVWFVRGTYFSPSHLSYIYIITEFLNFFKFSVACSRALTRWGRALVFPSLSLTFYIYYSRNFIKNQNS